MTNTINFDVIETHATSMSSALSIHDAAARSYSSQVKEIQAEYFVALVDVQTARDAMTDLGGRILTAISQVRMHIQNLESQKATVVANVIYQVPEDERDLPENVEIIEQRRQQIASEYDAVLQELRQKETGLLQLAEGGVRSYLGYFDDASSRLHRGLDAIGKLQAYEAGFAYNSIRLSHYVSSIRAYAASAQNNESVAMEEFTASLNWFNTPEGIAAHQGLVDYAEEVEATTPQPSLEELGVSEPIGYEELGVLPPTLEADLGVPFHNDYGDGDPETYEISDAYRAAGVYDDVNDEIQGWYSHWLSENPNGSFSDFSLYMVDLYDRGFPDTGSVQQANALTTAVDAYVSSNPATRNVYSFFVNWWTP